MTENQQTPVLRHYRPAVMDIKDLFQKLFVDGIHITKFKSNMKGTMMSVSDKVLLRKRAIIETVNDELKNIAQIELSRQRGYKHGLDIPNKRLYP